MCRERGLINAGTLTAGGAPQTDRRRMSLVADHVTPHRGDPHLFWCGELQTLCADHHDITKQRAEHRGFSARVGPDGWPVDPDHPANR